MESSIKIKNNSSTWNINQPVYLRVARPYTEEWTRQKQNDWFFRCQKEFENIQLKGGTCWFPTLTYNNDNLPLLYLRDYFDTIPIRVRSASGREVLESQTEKYINVNDSDYIQCFDVPRVRRFLKTLRVLLTRKGYNTNGMQYLCCPEYGSHTKRPHWHALIMIYDNVSESDMLDCLRRAWHYGFIGHGIQGLKVKSTYACRYVTKYVGKDMYFLCDQNFPHINMSLNDVLNLQNVYDPKEIRKTLRDYMPIMVISHGLGRCYLDNYLACLSDEHIIPYLTKEKTIALPLSFSNQFTLPQYYINKFCYEVDKDLSKYFNKTIALLTPLGEKVYSRKLGLRLSATKDKLNNLTPQICGDYYSDIFSVDTENLAYYLTYFRYLPYLSDNCTPSNAFRYAPEFVWSMCFDRKRNKYVVQKEYDDNLLFLDNEVVSESQAYLMEEYLNECYVTEMPLVSHNYGTWSQSVPWKEYEKAARAYDEVMNIVFTSKELNKRKNREQAACSKFECLTKMPHLITNYESI